MTAWERIVWIASWIAPVAGWVAVLAFAAVIVRPQIRPLLGHGGTQAWAIGALAALWALGHLTVRLHGVTSDFSRDERSAFHWKLNLGHGYAHWRKLVRRRRRGEYAGRSHSGE